MPARGVILLAGGLGGLETLYRNALEGSGSMIDTAHGFNANQLGLLEVLPELSFATDVSGYGLAGALWEFALSAPLHVELDDIVLATLAGANETEVPPCLRADLGDYGFP